MNRKKRDFFLKLLMLVGAPAVIMLLLPHNDVQDYVYEENQPWRYPLLMADFDMEVKRDAESAQRMRDSIDRNFLPIIKRQDDRADRRIQMFNKAITGKTPDVSRLVLGKLLNEIYARGVLDSKVYDRIQAAPGHEARIASKINGADALITIDCNEMMSPVMAFEFIDSAYRVSGAPVIEQHNDEIASSLNAILVPNVVLDTAADQKFRKQEYLTADASIGVIKKGQRIVDRGEIVTPQIFTNLNTYLQKVAENHDEDNTDTYFYVGQALFILICFAGLYIFLAEYRERFFSSLRKMLFLMTFITLFVVFAILMFEYFRNGIYLVPFAAVPVVILVFFDSRTAIFSLLVTVMISSIVAIEPLQFIFLELAAGLTAALSMRTLSRRGQLLNTAALSFVAYVLAYTTLLLLDNGTLVGYEWRLIGIFAINAVVLSFVYILVLVIEKLFGFTSTVTLVELSDINSPLLRRLAQEAPGTFQHSMQVSMLAAEGARAIGANTQLVRTGALYHDIGKLYNPLFFTENQHNVNPHDGLDPEVSAQKIISHVTKGLELAQKEKLPEMVRQFIPEHHGKSLTKYFYNTAVNNNPDPDHPIDRKPFMYPGPNPRSKETAILMMADSVEAASRSLTDYSTEAIDGLVDKIIDGQVRDGMFRDSPISFKDVEDIKAAFKKRLQTMYHGRVAYPEIKQQGEPAQNQPPRTKNRRNYVITV